jgi:hypothetical protein
MQFQQLKLPPMSLLRHVNRTLSLVRSIHKIRNKRRFGEWFWLRSHAKKAGGLQPGPIKANLYQWTKPVGFPQFLAADLDRDSFRNVVSLECCV